MRSILLFAVLAFAFRVSGQTSSPTTTYNTGIGHAQPMIPTANAELPNKLIGVVLESWRYDAQQKAVILHLVNQSHKDVTAFNISIAEKYADGSTDHTDGTPNDIHDHQLMEDMLGAIINIPTGAVSHGSGTLSAGANKVEVRGVRQGVGGGIFATGTSWDDVVPEAQDICEVGAGGDGVAYADGSADLLDNDRAFRNLTAERKGRLLAMEKVNEVIKRALGDSMVSDPVNAALNELLPFAESLGAKTKNRSPEVAENNVARNLQGDIQNLQGMREKNGSTQRESLARYVEYNEKLIVLMKPHCELVPR